MGIEIQLLQLITLIESHGTLPPLGGIRTIFLRNQLRLILIGIGLLIVDAGIDTVQQIALVNAVARAKAIVVGVPCTRLILVLSINIFRSMTQRHAVKTAETITLIGIAQFATKVVVHILTPIGGITTHTTCGMLHTRHDIVFQSWVSLYGGQSCQLLLIAMVVSRQSEGMTTRGVSS